MRCVCACVCAVYVFVCACVSHTLYVIAFVIACVLLQMFCQQQIASARAHACSSRLRSTTVGGSAGDKAVSFLCVCVRACVCLSVCALSVCVSLCSLFCVAVDCLFCRVAAIYTPDAWYGQLGQPGTRFVRVRCVCVCVCLCFYLCGCVCT